MVDNEAGIDLLIGLLGYLFFFFLIPRVFMPTYFKANAISDPDTADAVIEDYGKQEDRGYILAGSSLVALIFILSIPNNNLGKMEMIVVFFALALVFETLSSFLYHHVTYNIYGFLGMLLQYSGVLAMLMGFQVYFLSDYSWSLALNLIFPITLTVIVILTIKELKYIIDYWIVEENV